MDKQPFLIEQSIRYLDEIGDVKKYLHPNFFRRRRIQQGDQQEVDVGNWVDQTRIDLIQKLATRTLEGLGCRAVLTTDAGVGIQRFLAAVPNSRRGTTLRIAEPLGIHVGSV
jgi:hypothetical protein